MKSFAMAFGLALIVARVGIACGPSLDGDKELADLSNRLSACRAEARAAKDAGATSDDAIDRYESCKRRVGIQ